jgi:hypothetical protein
MKYISVFIRVFYFLFLTFLFLKSYSQIEGAYHSDPPRFNYEMRIDLYNDSVELVIDSGKTEFVKSKDSSFIRRGIPIVKIKSHLTYLNDSIFKIEDDKLSFLVTLRKSEPFNMLYLQFNNNQFLFYQASAYIIGKTEMWYLSQKTIDMQGNPLDYSIIYWNKKIIRSSWFDEIVRTIEYQGNLKHGKEYVNYTYEDFNVANKIKDSDMVNQETYYGNPPKKVIIWRNGIVKNEKNYPISKYMK